MGRSLLGLLSALVVVLLVVVGCGGRIGGASGAGGPSASSADRGRASVHVAWPVPVPGRVVPLAAQSIVVQLEDATGAVQARFTIVHPATSGTSPSVKAGTYALVATAYPTAAGTGTADATGTGSVTIVANATVPSSVTMGSTVTSLTLSPTTLTPTVGDATALAASAKDASGAIVLVAASTVSWTSSNPAVATVDATGLTPTLKAVAAGSATISAQFTEVEPTLGQQPVNATANVSVTVSAPPVTLAGSSWPKFRGDAANTGRGGGSGATGTTTKWTVSLSSTAVPTSYLAIGANGAIFLATSDGKVTALNRSTGTQIWSITPGTTSGAATLAATSDGNLYAFANNGVLSALNGATGATIWTFAAGSSAGSAITMGRDGTIYLASADNTVYAVKNATQRWSYKIGTTPTAATANPISALALGANGDLYLCGGVQVPGGGSADVSYSLYALKASTGAMIWSKSEVSGNPAVSDDGTVFASDVTGSVLAFSGTSGTPLWSRFPGLNGSLNSSVAVSKNGMVYYAATIQGALGGGITIALNAATGATEWHGQSLASLQISLDSRLGRHGLRYAAMDSTLAPVVCARWNDRLPEVELQYPPTSTRSPTSSEVAIGSDGTLYATMTGPIFSSSPGGLFAFR